MKTTTLRTLVPIIFGVLIAVGFAVNLGTGTFSAIGWGDVALLCPLGALTTMIAGRTLLPRALISLIVALVLILVFGRALCGWLCPVSVTKRLPDLLKSKKQRDFEAEVLRTTQKELGLSKARCGQNRACEGCDGCDDVKAKFDSRHMVLIASLLSAAIFGFPVFCLVCPIGLSFATIFLIMAMFGVGDVTWSIIFVPVLLLLEVTVFRKWCSKICPLSALMSLLGLANSRTLRPTVEVSKCIETKGGDCGRCADVCEVAINVRHPELGAGFNECLKCRACVDACPGQAITMPLFAPKAVLQGDTPALETAAAEEAAE